MNDNNIKPEKITKPIQLLAVWFSGLVILVGLLLAAAKTITSPIWITPLLCIAVILIIPLFLYFIFLMQTKYRPQMQDDSFYSKYLDQNTKQIINLSDNQSESNQYSELRNSFIEFSTAQKEKLEELNSVLSNINKSKDTERIFEITSSLNEEVNKIDEKTLKNVEIELNSLLPNYKKLFKVLSQSGYDSINLFQGGNNEPPLKFLISVGKNVEPKSVSEVIQLIRQFEDNMHISFIGDKGIVEERRMNQIVIGSYAYDNKRRKTHKVDSGFLDVLANIKTKEQFQSLLK